MRWSDWLLGRDTAELRLVRYMRTACSWAGWINLSAGLFYLAVVLPVVIGAIDSNVRTQQSVLDVLQTQVNHAAVGWLVPFLGWGLLTALLAIHDLFAADAEEVTDSDPDAQDEAGV